MFAVNRYQPERARQPAGPRSAKATHTVAADLPNGRDKRHPVDGDDERSDSVDNQQDDETITVISQRKARKLKRQQERAVTQHDEDDSEEQQRQHERREAKRAKRAARREEEQQQPEGTEQAEEHKEQENDLLQQKQPAHLVDLRALLALKSSTKARQDRRKLAVQATTAAVIKQTHASAVITPTSEVSKGQRKKDPAVRAAERAARKRARELKERRERGEVVDEDEEAGVAHLADATFTSQAASVDTADLTADAEHAPPTLTAEEEQVREQKRLAARPNWMMRGVHIDPASSCPSHSLPLHPALLSTLQRHGITDFFPVQATVLPFLLSPSASDVAVCSRTGSGKTLVYLLPILHRLTDYRVRRLRALVLVPSRDLAMQVAAEAREYGQGVGVKVGVSVGGGGWKREQAELVRRKDNRWSELIDYSSLTPLTSPDAYLFPASTSTASVSADEYDSVVDVLVTTPGRLIDHLNGTAGFTLAHLQWLVIDEVDRLLTQNYNDWAKRVHAALTPALPPSVLLYSDPAARCQKLLFSATLTGDPTSLAALHLQRPVLFIDSQSRQKRYTLPEGLRGSFYLCEAAEKPLLLLYVLSRITLVGEGKVAGAGSGARDRGEQVLIFTSSIESCHRVARLLQLWGYHASAEYSSSLTQHQRTQLLSAFRARHLSILVTSDLMARGLDITGITTVVNYDPPLHIQTHVHRAGRTARAGQLGSVVTLCKRREYSWFIGVVRRAANSMMDREKEDRQWMQAQQTKYGSVMERLREVIQDEKQGRLDRLARLSKQWSEERSAHMEVEQTKVAANKKGENGKPSKRKETGGADKKHQQHTAAVPVVPALETEDEGVDESEWSFAPSKQLR